jgi:hypothetical protein
VVLDFEKVVAVAEVRSALPAAYTLGQNSPNPFNPFTTITYGIPVRGHVSMTVFNTLGQQVAVLYNGDQDAGYHTLQFDARGLPSGVYFYRMHARSSDVLPGRDSVDDPGSFMETKKLLLIR